MDNTAPQIDILRQRLKKAKSMSPEQQLKWATEIQALETQFCQHIHQIYKDVYMLHKKYAFIANTKEAWQSLLKEINNINSKHSEDPFAVKLLLAVFDEIERRINAS